jgi:hypothetical protein
MSSVVTDSSSSNSSSNVLNDYDPAILSRYIHYYKTGRDINVDKRISEEESTFVSTTTTTGATSTAATNTTTTKQKKQKTKHVTPAVLELRRSIQLCCRDNTLPLALHTFHKALCDLIHVEPQTFYQLLNLCEGTFTQRGGVVHVGTPRFSPKDTNKNSNTTKMNSNLTTTNTTADNHSTAAQDSTNITNDGVSSTVAAELGNDETTTMTPTTVTKQLTLKQRLYHANVIYQLMSSLNIPLIEQAYTALIRLASRLCDFDTAIQYLNEAEKTPQCKGKLRMYSTLLRAYCGEFDNRNADDTNNDDDNYCMTTTIGVNVARPTLSISEQKQRLIQALTLWKRMYDNSGGWSTGHPNYCISAKAAKEGVVRDGNGGIHGTTTSTTTPLFGEGVIPKITLSECEYCAIMKLATIVNDYNVMERIISDVADTILIPGMQTTEVILQWFRCQSSNNNLSNTIISTELEGASSALHHVTLPPRDDPCLIGSVTNAHGWNIYVNCTIDVNTGKLLLGPRECNTTTNNESSTAHTITTTIDDDDTNKSKNYQYRLKPVGLTSKSWTTMREMNKKIVLEGQVEGHVSQYQGGGKGKKRSHGSDGSGSIISHNNQRHANSSTNKRNNNNDNIHSKSWRTNAWDQFETFIQQHPPYNIVIDGANVGYYEQNFVPITNNARSRHVDYKQIDWLVRHLLLEKQPQQETKEEEHHQQPQPYIILFLHERHFSNKLCPDWAYPIIQSWDSTQVPYNRLTVYRTPMGMNDDWFWMHAALIHGGGDSSSSSSGGDGGGRTTISSQQSILAITNDEMRDHHFQMLAEGSFLRWKERHQVHFDFGPWNKELQRRDVLLQYPSSYSRRIQRVERDHDDDDGDGTSDAFVIPLPKKGDERRFADGQHVAEDGVPDEEMYIVIQRVSRCKTKM